MANTYTTLDSLFTGIADAIRLKNGSTGVIVADTFPTEISNLRTGFDYNNHNVSVIEDYQFKNCTDLRKVDCYSVIDIGASAFEGCTELETVVLYNRVQSIGEDAFKGCSDLTIYCMFDGQPDGWDENWNPDDCEVIFVAPVKTWDISATENDNVTAMLYNNEGFYLLVIIGSGNMKDWNTSSTAPWYNYRKNITSINISDSITSIGNYAFYDCSSLTSINIPDSVTSIGSSAFYSCDALTSITIPESVTSISYGVFNKCKSLTSITIPNSVTSIGSYIFDGCTALTSITIPESVVEIGTYEFHDCKSLEFINYRGTIAQWSTIIFGSNWNYNTPNYTIYCTDGTISKDGTITYY